MINILVHLSNFGKILSPTLWFYFYFCRGFLYAHYGNKFMKADGPLFLSFSHIALVLGESFPTQRLGKFSHKSFSYPLMF